MNAPNNLLEMLRSFVELSKTLNLSKAVRNLGTTRQTVRRHIDCLEEARGDKLFQLRDRQYQLTPFGKQSLNEAKFILARADAWVLSQTQWINDLEFIESENDSGAPEYYSQQHRLDRIQRDGTPLIQSGFSCWANSQTFIESPELKLIRPFLLIYRPSKDGWQCVEIGESSSYAVWFGWEWAKSNVGHTVKETPAGTDYADHILQAYQMIYENGGVRFDHLIRQVPRKKDGPSHSICFQRLLIGLTFPNGDRALGVLADATEHVDIAGLDKNRIERMPEQFLKQYNVKIAEFIK